MFYKHFSFVKISKTVIFVLSNYNEFLRQNRLENGFYFNFQIKFYIQSMEKNKKLYISKTVITLWNDLTKRGETFKFKKFNSFSAAYQTILHCAN